MNYYIQGDPARAEEIKAEFKRLGYDTRNFDYSCGLFVTFNNDRDVHYLSYGSQIADIIKTHPDYKELELPVQPKFKDGDEVVFGTLHETIAVVLINEQRYLCETCREILFKEQDRWNLAPKPHYDISNFHAGMPVLVRANNDCRWDYSVFSRITGNECWQFAVCNGVCFTQCIPFEGNEHLLGTIDPCDEQYINW